MNELLSSFHFLRPAWLLALLLVPLLLWRWRRLANRDHWLRDFIDPALREHVSASALERSRLAPAWLALLLTLTALALAGPAWRQQEVALYRVQAPLVVVLDLSAHMAADDLKPDRITQARFKLISLLKERAGGQAALIAYAGDAFTVAPLTEDANTVSAMVESLSPMLMPVDGQRADLALTRAQRLLADAGFRGGDVLLVSDTADAAALAQARVLAAQGVRVSALGIGSSAGAMLRDGKGGLVYDSNGTPQLARLDESALQALSAAGDGRYARLRADNGDLTALDLLSPRDRHAGALSASGEEATRWRDEGPWLLPLVLILALLGFRRGALAMVATLALLPLRPAHALDWDVLWRTPEQRADAALRAGDIERARALARDPARAGAAAYRAGDWNAAIAHFAPLHDAHGQYNLGNALAMAERFDEAIAAYDRALAQDPAMSDAIRNRELLIERKKQQPPKSQQSPAPKQGTDSSGATQQDGEGGDSSDGEQGESGPSDPGKGDGAPSPDRAQGAGDKGESGDAGAALPEDTGDAGGRDHQPDSTAHASTADAAANQQALSDAMSEALRDAEGEPGLKPTAESSGTVMNGEQRQQREQQQAVEAWLRRVPDDPGGLLRRKFLIEYQRRQQEGTQE